MECYVTPALCLHIRNSIKASAWHIFWQNPLCSSWDIVCFIFRYFYSKWLKSQRSRVRYPVRPHTCTFVSLSSDSSRAVVSYWRKYVHQVLVNHLGGLSLPRKSVVRLTDRPDMTIDVYFGRKTTIQQQQQQPFTLVPSNIQIIYSFSTSER